MYIQSQTNVYILQLQMPQASRGAIGQVRTSETSEEKCKQQGTFTLSATKHRKDLSLQRFSPLQIVILRHLNLFYHLK